VVVICPKCKTRLKIDEAKLKTGGSRFKCPRCSALLLVKKPAPKPEKPVDNKKILVAHSNPNVVNEITENLKQYGYQVVSAADGIEAMVKTIKELPFLAILEVSLPKIYGFEVCKRLKTRAETKTTKFILVSSIYDQKRYKREPSSLYDADDYIEEHQIPKLLAEKVNALKGELPEEKEEKVEKPSEKTLEEQPEPRKEPPPGLELKADDKIERAKRLVRTIISDIYLYNTAKAEQSIKKDSFYSEFAAELREGRKLYESRIEQEVRSMGDFFNEAIREFIENKKKSL